MTKREGRLANLKSKDSTLYFQPTGLYNKVLTRTYEPTSVPGRATGFTLGTDCGVTYGYEPATGRFNTVAWNVAGATDTATYSYVPNSELLQNRSTVNGQQTTYLYEANRNLKTQVRNTFGIQIVSQYDYAHDALGRRDSVVTSGTAFTASAFNRYDYNDRNELTESGRYLGTNVNDTGNPVPSEYRDFDYDPIGNRTAAIEGATTIGYTPNNLNQYSTIVTDNGQPTTDDYTFDKDGNLTDIVGSENIHCTYNAENRLIAVEPITPTMGDKKVECVYDYMGRRVQKVVSTWDGAWTEESEKLFVYDGWNLIWETTDNGLLTTNKFYVWGLDLSQSMQGAGGIGGLLAVIEPGEGGTASPGDFDEDGDVDGEDVAARATNPGLLDLATFAGNFGTEGGGSGETATVYYYLYDANGNVGQVVDGDDGSIAAHYEYDPFGNLTNSYGALASENSFRFSTKYTDDETGLIYYGYRFYSPQLGRWLNRDPIGEEGGSNLYLFTDNSAINTIDVIGLWKSGTHEYLTTKSWKMIPKPADMLDLAEKFLELLIDANVGVDSGYTSRIPAWHFTRALDETPESGKLKYKSLLKAQETILNGYILNANKLNCEEALKELGKLSHAWQDYYAHGIRMENNVSPRESTSVFSFYGEEAYERYGGTPPGRIEGSPDNISQNIKPCSWGKMPILEGGIGNTGEHGAIEPGDRAPDRPERLNQARTFVADKWKVQVPEWWRACKCYLNQN